MTSKLIWGVLTGGMFGAMFGTLMGSTPIGIAVCVVAGSIGAAVAHYVQRQTLPEGDDA